jgi:hypothetical protein
MEDQIMKNIIIKIFAGAAAVATLFSCDSLNETPEFKNKDSFAAFTTTSYSVAEDVGSLSIPVTIASIDPIATSVSYTVTAGTATSGTNYSLVDPSAVLAFDGTERTANIDINIVNIPDEYTGDLSFTVTLESATGINIGSENTCTVTITDNDHPLSDILGTYSVHGYDAAYASYQDWTATFYKDPDDVTVVWISGIAPVVVNNSSVENDIYGQVTREEGSTVITIPCGQTVASSYNDDGALTFVNFYYNSGYYGNSNGSIILTDDTTTSSVVFYADKGIGFFTNNYLYYGGAICGPDTDSQYEITFTKQ